MVEVPAVTFGVVAAAARSGAIAFAVTPAAIGLERTVLRRPMRGSILVWLLLLLPVLTPVLVVGYTYTGRYLSLLEPSVWREAAYSGLVFARTLPVAVLVVHFAPFGISPEARRCHQLLRAGTSGWRHLRIGLRLGSRGLVALAGTVFGLSFLLVFTEFELASFFRVRHWSVSLFDAQAGGLAFSETWRLAWLPGAIAIAALGTAVGWVLRLGSRPGPAASPQPAARLGVLALGMVYLLSAAWFSSLFPGWLLLRDAARGGAALAGSFRLQEELVTSVLVAGAASVITFLASGWVHAALRRWSNPAARIGILTLCLPGLLGPLLLSLLLLRVFQIPLLHVFYDSPVPLLLGLCLWLGPPALLCRIVLEARRPGQAHHVAMLSRASPSPTARAWVRTADWRMRRSPWFWLGSLLFVWAYLDLTTAALLTPSGMALVMTRLYNFMHYGQTSMLSAMLTATMLVPAVCIGLVYVVGRRGWSGHV